MLKFVTIGFGGMGQAHKSAYGILEAAGEPLKLTAICDIEPERFKKATVINIDTGSENNSLEGINIYYDAEEMVLKEKPDVVDICLPTYLHEEYTKKMLAHGFHVMCEKPMARSYEGALRMVAAAKEAGKKLMIGQCLRFSGEYLWLKDAIKSGEFGKVKSAYFERLSSYPIWSFENWFMNFEKSGGCVLDMHIHDVDMVRFLFGEPKWISAQVSNAVKEGESVNTRFGYDGIIVSATGDWSLGTSFSFQMSFRVNFENATVILENGQIWVYPNEGEAYNAEYDDSNRVANEIKFFAESIINGGENSVNTPESAAKSVELVEKIYESSKLDGAAVKV